jgi:hypothetical protein
MNRFMTFLKTGGGRRQFFAYRKRPDAQKQRHAMHCDAQSTMRGRHCPTPNRVHADAARLAVAYRADRSVKQAAYFV